MKVDLSIVNSVDPNEMQHYHHGFHCLTKDLFPAFKYAKA